MHQKVVTQDIMFPGRKVDEQVVLVLRRHWAILAGHSLLSIVILALPLAVAALGNFLIPQINETLLYPYLVVAFFLYLMFFWVYFFLGWVDYYLDVWIVTNDRIINIEQNGLFNRIVSEQKLYRVQDVTAEAKGFLPTLLNYGNVYIQTAGEQSRFIFEQVPEPYQVKKLILEYNEIALKEEADVEQMSDPDVGIPPHHTKHENEPHA